jgi:pyruvate/2-oxoglutarate dehydrogenase complex dihydrolipoamide acyltransferase (E2) component
MKTLRARLPMSLLPLLAALAVTPAGAQVPVDDSGAPLADYESFEPEAPAGNEDIPLLTQGELQELVGPIALYPDDLLAIVLPASTYPLQLVQAQRFLEDLEEDPSLQPDDSWDDSVIALLNYPEVVELLNEDLDWTWRLGEAVVAKQADVVGAVESFRERAYAAGNLRSDTHQTVARNEGAIEITPVEDDVIYVPYYEPERVVVYQARPVYHYYPRAYPVYYYPYPVGYAFNSGFFWGVTTAFTVGWLSDSVHVYHHSYYGHPYYGHHYWDGWWYRRPSIHVHNHYYSIDRHSVSRYRYDHGDHWRPRYDTRRRLHDQRIARSDYYSGRSVQQRSYTTTRAREIERRPGVSSNAGQRRDASGNAERRRTFSGRAADERRQQRQVAAPAATRQAPRPEARPQRSADERQTRYATPRMARAERDADSRRQAYVQRQPSRPETAARQEQRAASYRQEQTRASSPRREEPRASSPRQEEPQRARPQPSRDKNRSGDAEPRRQASSRGDSEPRRHASSRGDSERRQRH